jgi:hypothetical protein
MQKMANFYRKFFLMHGLKNFLKKAQKKGSKRDLVKKWRAQAGNLAMPVFYQLTKKEKVNEEMVHFDGSICLSVMRESVGTIRGLE